MCQIKSQNTTTMKMSVTTVFPDLLTFENFKSGNTVNYNWFQKKPKTKF